MDKRLKVARVNFNIRKKNFSNLPILYVRFSNKHVYVQFVHNNKIVFDVSSLNQDIFKQKSYNNDIERAVLKDRKLNDVEKAVDNDRIKSYNIAGAKKIGEIAGSKIRELGFKEYVMNRGDRVYKHKSVGILQALEMAVRESLRGIKE